VSRLQKILVIGLEVPRPEAALLDERLENLRGLMAVGCYGCLEASVDTSEAFWSAFATGRKPQANVGCSPSQVIVTDSVKLGSRTANARTASTIWDVFDRAGERTILIETGDEGLTDVPHVAVSVRELPSQSLGASEQSPASTHAAFDRLRQNIRTGSWGYLHLLVHGFEAVFGGEPPGPDELLHLDEEIGRTLELLDEDTLLAVILARATLAHDRNNHAPPATAGAFVLAGAALSIVGEVEKASIHDLAPTLLVLSGREIPATMEGRSLAASAGLRAGEELDEDEIVRARLSGLGYLG
jgi:hypothetical protein